MASRRTSSSRSAAGRTSRTRAAGGRAASAGSGRSAPRSGSGRSSAGRSSGRRRPPQSNPQPIVLGVVGLAVVILIVVLVTSGKGDKPARAQENTKQPKIAAKASSTPATTSWSSAERAIVSGSKKPGRACPSLPASTFRECNVLLDEAKQLFNDAERMRRTEHHDKTAYFALLHKCKQNCEAALAKLEPVLMWQEEAIDNDWQTPKYVDHVAALFQKISSVRTKAFKNSRGR